MDGHNKENEKTIVFDKCRQTLLGGERQSIIRISFSQIAVNPVPLSGQSQSIRQRLCANL